MGFSNDLFKEVENIWNGYLEHSFVKEIGLGTLDKEKFKNYLIQDYLYLKEYAKVFAIGITKAKTMKEMKFFYNSIEGIIEDETAVHINYLKNFGISKEEIEKYKAHLTTESYTSYMISTATKGNIKEIAMTIMPCTWSYYFIGKNLREKYSYCLEENFYKEWIEDYSSNDFRQCTEDWINYIDEICENISDKEKEDLKEIFIKSSLYEMEFWKMAYSEVE